MLKPKPVCVRAPHAKGGAGAGRLCCGWSECVHGNSKTKSACCADNARFNWLKWWRTWARSIRHCIPGLTRSRSPDKKSTSPETLVMEVMHELMSRPVGGMYRATIHLVCRSTQPSFIQNTVWWAIYLCKFIVSFPDRIFPAPQKVAWASDQ